MRLTIDGDSLSLRPFEIDDAEIVSELTSDYEVTKMLGRVPYPNPANVVRDWIETHGELNAAGREYPFAVIDPQLGLVGSIGVTHVGSVYEIGYWVGRRFWGRGIATEAAKMVSVWAETELDIDRLMAGHYVDNPSSGRVLEKAGYRYTGATENRFSLARSERVTTRIYLRERAQAAA